MRAKKDQIFLISKAFMLLEHKIASHHDITLYVEDTWSEADEVKGLKEGCPLPLPILSLQGKSFSVLQSFVDVSKLHSTLRIPRKPSFPSLF